MPEVQNDSHYYASQRDNCRNPVPTHFCAALFPFVRGLQHEVRGRAFKTVGESVFCLAMGHLIELFECW